MFDMCALCAGTLVGRPWRIVYQYAFDRFLTYVIRTNAVLVSECPGPWCGGIVCDMCIVCFAGSGCASGGDWFL